MLAGHGSGEGAEKESLADDTCRRNFKMDFSIVTGISSLIDAFAAAPQVSLNAP
jgi:hypothetical protein